MKTTIHIQSNVSFKFICCIIILFGTIPSYATYTNSSGSFGIDWYGNDWDETVYINVSCATQITINYDIDTESCCDHVTITDYYTGEVYFDESGEVSGTITLNTNRVRVRFTSDPSVSNEDGDDYDGYSMSYTATFPVTPVISSIITVSGSIRLTWEESINNSCESSYTLQRSVGNNSSFSNLVTLPANTFNYNDNSVQSGTTYYYRVKPDNVSTWSNQTSATVLSVPTGFAFSNTGSNEFTLNWADNSSNETNFVLEQSIGDDQDFVVIAPDIPANSTSYSIANLLENERYYYRIFAKSSSSISTYSSSINSYTQLIAPTALSVTPDGTGKLYLAWGDNSNAEQNYIIERSVNSNSAFNPYATLNANINEYFDASVIEGITYFYRVKATNSNTFSDYSNEADGTNESQSNAGTGWELTDSILHTEKYVGIGTSNINGDFKLFVKNGIRAERVKVDIASENNWSDFVFEPGYELLNIHEVEKHINLNKCLPDVPSAKEVTKEGIDLAEMNALLLMKIEELTLYLIEQNKKIEALEEEINCIKEK